MNRKQRKRLSLATIDPKFSNFCDRHVINGIIEAAAEITGKKSSTIRKVLDIFFKYAGNKIESGQNTVIPYLLKARSRRIKYKRPHFTHQEWAINVMSIQSLQRRIRWVRIAFKLFLRKRIAKDADNFFNQIQII